MHGLDRHRIVMERATDAISGGGWHMRADMTSHLAFWAETAAESAKLDQHKRDPWRRICTLLFKILEGTQDSIML